VPSAARSGYPPESTTILDLDKVMLAQLVDNSEDVMAAGTNPKKKDLLRRLVKKVLVHSRRTIEIWYALPNPARFEDWHKWLLRADSNHQPTG
jgi:hypothetical protein